MKYKIGVMGKATRSKDLPEVLVKNAEIIGKEIARNGCVLVTGACMGVSEIASKAASKEGGLSLWFSPGKNLKQHLEPPISYPRPFENVELIFTGAGKEGRIVPMIRTCDGVIFIGGGIGTSFEFAAAYHEGKVMGILKGVGGAAEKMTQLAEDFKETGATIIEDKDPKVLVRKVIEEIQKREEKPRTEIPITFKNERGKNLVGVLHLPEREKPPLVIICHGFQGTKTDRKYVRLAKELVKEGIAAFRFDFEGCGDSEGDPKDIKVEREVSDLKEALKAVLKEADFDSKRIALVGGSLGSVVCASFVERFKVPIKTLIFWTQAFNQSELFKIWYTVQDQEEFKKKGFIIKGEKEIGSDYYLENKDKDYSSVLAKIELPILLIQGGEDKDVPLEFSKKLADKYKNINLKILPKASHKFDELVSQQRLTKLTIDWLKKNL